MSYSFSIYKNDLNKLGYEVINTGKIIVSKGDNMYTCNTYQEFLNLYDELHAKSIRVVKAHY